MFSLAILGNVASSALATYRIPGSCSVYGGVDRSAVGWRLKTGSTVLRVTSEQTVPSIAMDSLRVLEWDQVCDSVASFAATSLGKQAAKEQLWSLNKAYEDSLKLLEETKAAVEMYAHGAMMDFGGLDTALVNSAMRCARRGCPVSGKEARALVALLQFAEALQLNVKAAIKQDAEFYQRFMPLSGMIMELVISRSLVILILQVVSEDGTVKDSASPSLKKSRDQVLSLERKLNQLMESLIRNQMKETSTVEVSNINGRWCIKSSTDCRSSLEGLLLSSGSGAGTIVEPLSAVALNDALQQARTSVADAESAVLLRITSKMHEDLEIIEDTFRNMIQLDAISARARYSISFGGSYPDLFLPQGKDNFLPNDTLTKTTTSFASNSLQRNWILYLPKSYHPLLLQQHRQKLQKAKKDVSDTAAEIRRRRHGGSADVLELDLCLSSLELKVDEIKKAPPVPCDIFVSQGIRVVVITGPNTGGKTIVLKTIGLAIMMAKSGLFVLSSEPARLPWCDFVFADIGDEQSLSQSLSTFSGHLKRITEILSSSTHLSFALLDEVGAGTNPLEGAALGMSLLEYFAEAGPLLTMATTHHGELKTLKYSNSIFENACMEFDEVNLKPTFRILWGVPGRSNAINIAERLGLPSTILGGARELFGAASAEINEIILEMEMLKQYSNKQASVQGKERSPIAPAALCNLEFIQTNFNLGVLMFSLAILGNVASSALATYRIPGSCSVYGGVDRSAVGWRLKTGSTVLRVTSEQTVPSIAMDSLRVLEWDQVCDSVASFAATSLGKQAAKEQLWSLNKAYEDSLKLLEETKAAVEMYAHGAMMDFGGLDTALVNSAMRCARRGCPVSGKEARALVALLQFAEALQLNVKAAIKQDAEFYQRFMPLSGMIMELVISRSLVILILQVVSEDGTVKDSASPSLKKSRDQVLSLERKLNQLMESLIRNQMKETSTVEVSNINGRWCIKSSTDCRSSLEGLLLSSGSGAGTIVEPLSAVALNDALQQARTSVADAESAVLLRITSKMHEDLEIIEDTFRNMIQLDAISARARYSISFGGSYPDLFLPQGKDNFLPNDTLTKTTTSFASNSLQRNWILYLPKSYHPLLLQQHRQKLQKAKKDVSDTAAEIRRRRHGGSADVLELDLCLSSLELKVDEIKKAPPVPCDIFVSQGIRVVVITGPNTGGKTIVLKTIGLAIMMAKSGLFVLSSEPARLPWCDFVFADIGDEQSLSQSLSTFSGHLKRITEILSSSTHLSFALLDEVGAGTNPLEGAALGMSLLEYFAEAGPLLTMATTHHGELKTLKYSNSIFENACMEFDEVNLKPTFRILWGVPGRSNAINIAERLGLPSTILGGARELFGAASAEINEIILEMEMLKQYSNKQVREAQHYLMLSKHLHQKLTAAAKEIYEHGTSQSYQMLQEMSKVAAAARSLLHEQVRELRVFAAQDQRNTFANKNDHIAECSDQNSTISGQENFSEPETSTSTTGWSPIADMPSVEILKKGDVVQVPSLKQKAVVLKVEASKEEIVVQAAFEDFNIEKAVK